MTYQAIFEESFREHRSSEIFQVTKQIEQLFENDEKEENIDETALKINLNNLMQQIDEELKVSNDKLKEDLKTGIGQNIKKQLDKKKLDGESSSFKIMDTQSQKTLKHAEKKWSPDYLRLKKKQKELCE